ncbi:MAG TPA: UDP-3-O-acyl-N-acetylglucosamine deacetylase [Caulobacteraceae bacterium]|nr:UDP-3-O-acyl-N-acetylglucosamine deacetylase [Caulobacteraceae bacterium]
MPSAPEFQHTLAGPAVFAGVGLHSGQRVRAAILPAPTDTGIAFLRTDLKGDGRIEARAQNVVSTRLSTVVANASGATVSTVEHLMAALHGLGIDNALVELDGPEAPIMDGSAEPFVRLIDRAGRRRQEAPRQAIEILEPVEIIEGDKRAALVPAQGFELAVEIAFDSAAIGRQHLDLVVTEASFRSGLAGCRTFGFLHEVEALRQAGLIRGGGLENAIVIDGDAVLNPEGLKRPDEFVRHKAVDAIGDLATLGAPLVGRYEGRYAGHAMNNALARALLDRPEAFRLRALSPVLAEAV